MGQACRRLWRPLDPGGRDWLGSVRPSGAALILLIIVLILLFGGGFGYWGHAQYGANNQWAGPGIGLGTVLIILLICYLLGVL